METLSFFIFGVVVGWIIKSYCPTITHRNPIDGEIRPLINVEEIKCRSSDPKTKKESQQ